MGVRTSGNVTHALTGAAPTVETDFVNMYDAQGIRVLMKSADANPITAGKLLCWYWDHVEGAMRNPQLDLDVPAGTSALKLIWPDLEVVSRYGGVTFVPSAIVGPAANCVVRVDVWGTFA